MKDHYLTFVFCFEKFNRMLSWDWRNEQYAEREERRSVDEAVGPIIERT